MGAHVLYLIIQLGGDRYALEAAGVTEIVPLVHLKMLPAAPAITAGLMNYRGTAVPVIDLGCLVVGAPTARTASTRIVIIRDPESDRSDPTESLGLLVPAATDTVRLDPDNFVFAGTRADASLYLGPVLATPEGVIQRLVVSAFFTGELRGALPRDSEAA